MVSVAFLMAFGLSSAYASDPALPLLNAVESGSSEGVRAYISQVAKDRLSTSISELPAAARRVESDWDA